MRGRTKWERKSMCRTSRNSILLFFFSTGRHYWAQEHSQKSLSLNTVRCVITKQKPCTNTIQKHNLLWTKVHLKLSQNGKLFCDQMSSILKYFLETMDAKEQRNHPAVISRQFNSCISDGMEVH